MNGPDGEQQPSPVQGGPGTSPPWPDEAIEAAAQIIHEVYCDNCDECEGIVDDDREQARVALTAAAEASPSEAPRDVDIDAAMKAGQRLAIKWGHQPWSDSWARLVATTIISAGVPDALLAPSKGEPSSATG